MNRQKMSLLNIYIIIVLFCIYIFPSGFINNGVLISKYIFLISSILLYIIEIIKTKTLKTTEILYLSFIIIYSCVLHNIEFLMFLTLPLLYRIMKYKYLIKDYLKKSKFIYVCLLFTIIYSILNFGYNGRYAFSAIKEINQSGLAIFCLSCLIYYNNKNIGIISFLFGMLTISRSYFLALLLFIFYNKFIKSKIKSNSKIIKLLNYKNMTIITSIMFVLLGYVFLFQYYNGNIIWQDNVSNRLINIFDVSNFFRFTAVINLLYILKNKPLFLINGMTQAEYIEYGMISSSELEIPYKYTVPHNLFFSHLKLYGIFSIFETLIIYRIFKKIVTKDNFGIFIGLNLYSCFLGAGFYSYWAYLSAFLIILYNESLNVD